jgi:hypothetical protein
MHPNGLYAFIANSNANKIEIIDMKTFTIVLLELVMFLIP